MSFRSETIVPEASAAGVPLDLVVRTDPRTGKRVAQLVRIVMPDTIELEVFDADGKKTI